MHTDLRRTLGNIYIYILTWNLVCILTFYLAFYLAFYLTYILAFYLTSFLAVYLTYFLNFVKATVPPPGFLLMGTTVAIANQTIAIKADISHEDDDSPFSCPTMLYTFG